MPIEFDDLGLRIIGHNVKGIRFYDDERVLRAEIYLQDDNTLNIGGGIGGGITVVEGGGAPTDAQYVVAHLHDGLSNERVLTAGPGVGLVDGGANGALTVSIETSCSFLAPVQDVLCEDGNEVNWHSMGFPLVEDLWSIALGSFVVPANYGSGLTVEALIYSGASGNLFCKNSADFATCGESSGTHYVTSNYGTGVAVTDAGWNCIRSLALTDAEPGDIVILTFNADRDDVLDTAGDTVYMPGWRWSYEKKKP